MIAAKEEDGDVLSKLIIIRSLAGVAVGWFGSVRWGGRGALAASSSIIVITSLPRFRSSFFFYGSTKQVRREGTPELGNRRRRRRRRRKTPKVEISRDAKHLHCFSSVSWWCDQTRRAQRGRRFWSLLFQSNGLLCFWKTFFLLPFRCSFPRLRLWRKRHREGREKNAERQTHANGSSTREKERERNVEGKWKYSWKKRKGGEERREEGFA